MTGGVRSAVHAFVGRETQMRTLRSAAIDAARGRGSLALVAGEPGVGKTRLADELARLAAGSGLRVLWATCKEEDGVPPFWPWMQLVPELARQRDQPVAVLAIEAEEERFRLFEGIAASLRQAALATPLLLVIDDLHWADTASLLLLRFIARELRGSRLLVVGTYRNVEIGGPLRELLASVAGSCTHLALRGLAPGEVADLVGSLSGRTPSWEHVNSLHDRTNGNPLFVRELVQLTADSSGGDLGVPEGVRGVIQRRLGRLSERCRTLLSAAATLGQQFKAGLLEAIAGRSGEELAAALEEAVAAHLVEEVPGVVPRYRFTHALVVEVLLQATGARGRRELHGRTARALEAVFRDDAEPRSEQLGHHFRLAGEWAKAVEYATIAGHRAFRMLAYESAAGHFERALEMQEAAGTGDQTTHCRLLLAVAEARMASAETGAARDTYERAAALARLVNVPELLARAALGVGLASTMGVVDHLEIRLLETALDAVGEADSVLRSRLLARLAVALLDTASPERRRALSDQAAAMARRLDEPVALAAALLDRHLALFMYEPAAERLTVSGEVVRLANLTGDRRLEMRAHLLRAGSLLELGDMDAVGTELAICESITDELGMGERSWQLPMVRSGLAALTGRLEEAERLAERGLRQGAPTRHPGVEVFHGSIIGMIRYLQGRLPELEDVLRRSVDRYPTAPEWRCTLALALCDAGRPEEARQQFEIVAAENFAIVSAHLSRLHSVALLALVCDAVGDARRAALLYPLLAPHAARFVQVGQTAAGGLGSASHYVGLLACAMSRWDEAVAHFETAIAMNARIGAVPFVANSRYQLARALRALGGAAAQARAREQLDLAEETASALGLRLWRGGTSRPAPAAGGVALSRREWEVARLVADGLGNGEIAERLHISKRTVETHLEHVRGKLLAGSRAAIVSWVVQRT
jgi:DNA-binding CsgD family transcriptional regulator